jgi:hypothetical protein
MANNSNLKVILRRFIGELEPIFVIFSRKFSKSKFANSEVGHQGVFIQKFSSGD